ncbi:MAG: hypothetical protein RI911_171 [Candidatus Parcubacteria bacterium]|jgi:myo-inositol-1(or 4)-monophosphatase
MTVALFERTKEAVREAGRIAEQAFFAGDMHFDKKPDMTVVTLTDKAVEENIVSFISKHFPEDSIIGEETGKRMNTSSFVWHIDPIDGTENFLRRIPFFGISVARLGDTPEGSFGMVYNPITKQLFSSYKDAAGDMYENERVCKMTPDKLGSRYFINMGRRAREPWMKTATFSIQKDLSLAYGRCWSMGCTSLELSYLAANRIDGFITFGLDTYDYAAGLFLVRASGGKISVFEGGQWLEWTGSIKALCEAPSPIIFASHPETHEMFLKTIGDPTQRLT